MPNQCLKPQPPGWMHPLNPSYCHLRQLPCLLPPNHKSNLSFCTQEQLQIFHCLSHSDCARFEAGTPAIGEAIGLGAAIDYLSGIGMQKIHEYEVELGNYLYESLLSVPNICIYGPATSEKVQRASLCSFNVENIHPTDLATFLDQQHGVAIRSGHHCAQPLHRYLGVSASARASLYFYNTKEDIDKFIQALNDTVSFFNSFK